MRSNRGWSPDELAAKAGLPASTILAYEADPASLTSRTAVRILDGMSPDLLDGGLFEASPPSWLITEMEARRLEREAASCIDQGLFQEALERLDRALALKPCPEQTGRLLLTRAAVLGEIGWNTQALEALREAERCLDAEAEPRLWLRLRLEQMYLLCQVDRLSQAQAFLNEVQELAQRIGTLRDRQQANLLAGWILGMDGWTQKALWLLADLRADLMDDNRLFEAGGVSLDIAILLAVRQDQSGIAEVVRKTAPLTGDKRLSDASRATLIQFCVTVEHGKLTPEVGRQLALEYRRTGRRLPLPYVLPV